MIYIYICTLNIMRSSVFYFFFSSRRRHTRWPRDWSSDVCSSDLTGVEMAGALSELIRLVLVKDYPRLNIKDVRVLLLEATDRLLAAMPDRLGDAAAKILWRKKHVEVRFGAAVQDFDGARITLKSGEVIPARTLIWAAGAKAVSLTTTLGLTTARQGRVAVTPELQAPDHPEVYVIGDAAYLEHDGAPLPMMAPVAIQMADTA